MEVKAHLDILASELKIDNPLYKEGLFTLTINPEIQIQIKPLDVGFLVQAPIGPCPTQKREELFIHLMRANFLGQGTGKAIIGLDLEEKFLTLQRFVAYDLKYQGFKETLEDFSNFVDYWKQELSAHETTGILGK